MDFTPSQAQALESVKSWLQGPEPVFRLFGYAGTGKTTLARHIKADFYAAFTGKAAYVLRNKGCDGASTIHKLIYVPSEKSRKRLMELIQKESDNPNDTKIKEEIEKERENLNRPYFTLDYDAPLHEGTVVAVDECSMVDKRIGEDLLSFGCKVLVLGDPFQLPPVKGGGYFTSAEPDILLVEPHRFAKDQPIYRIATTIREGEEWYDDDQVIESMSSDLALHVDQIIVGTHKKRHRVNNRMRQLLGFNDPMPMVGDKLICMRNDHRIGILNGATYHVKETKGGTLVIEDTESKSTHVVRPHAEPFIGHAIPDSVHPRSAEHFEYGYGITCHKAQGSQWDKVLVIDESSVFRGNSRRWLYTAVTRAAKELWVASGR